MINKDLNYINKFDVFLLIYELILSTEDIQWNDSLFNAFVQKIKHVLLWNVIVIEPEVNTEIDGYTVKIFDFNDTRVMTIVFASDFYVSSVQYNYKIFDFLKREIMRIKGIVPGDKHESIDNRII